MLKVRKLIINNNKKILLIGILTLIFGIVLIIADTSSTIYIRKTESEALKKFYNIETKKTKDNESNPVTEEINNKKTSYIASIKIPKINLDRGLVSPNSKYNNIKYNIEVLKESSMPDEKNGNVILASHAGNDKISYFKDLDKLTIGDKVILHYNGKKYTYLIVNIYDIERTGQARIIRSSNKRTLTLITCRHNTTKQIVIICESID